MELSGWLPLAAGVGSAVAGGFYFAFAAVVIPALRRRPTHEAAATMVAINEAAVRPPFMLVFFGTAAACGGTAAAAVADPQAHSLLRLAGSAAYLAGWVLTMAVNVPHNNRLAAGGVGHWPAFDRSWTRANHVRAILSVTGAAALMLPTPALTPVSVVAAALQTQ
jgi:uncharacterized membrane protein